jgi:hypothetical protein
MGIQATKIEIRTEWDSLVDVLDGVRPEQVDVLVQARQLEMIYPLVHALTRGSMGDFFLRVATLEAFVCDGRSPIKPQDALQILYFLKEPESILRLLRETGWLEFEPAFGYRITDTGRFVATVLSFLRHQIKEQALVPTMEGVDYAIRCGVDPVRQLMLLRAQLEDLRTEMEIARSSHSEILLRQAAGRLSQSLTLSERIRAVLAKVPLDMSESRAVVNEIHDLLSRLHGVGSELHSAITEVGRQYLHLVAGMNTSDIVASLMRMPVRDLAAAAGNSLFPLALTPPLVSEEMLAASAEAYVARQIEQAPVVAWVEPPVAEDATLEAALPPEVNRLADDLDDLIERSGFTTFHEFVPKNTASESFLRASLLPLVGKATGGEGVAGRLGAMKISVVTAQDGALQPSAHPLSELTAGRIEVVSTMSEEQSNG